MYTAAKEQVATFGTRVKQGIDYVTQDLQTPSLKEAATIGGVALGLAVSGCEKEEKTIQNPTPSLTMYGEWYQGEVNNNPTRLSVYSDENTVNDNHKWGIGEEITKPKCGIRIVNEKQITRLRIDECSPEGGKVVKVTMCKGYRSASEIIEDEEDVFNFLCRDSPFEGIDREAFSPKRRSALDALATASIGTLYQPEAKKEEQRKALEEAKMKRRQRVNNAIDEILK